MACDCTYTCFTYNVYALYSMDDVCCDIISCTLAGLHVTEHACSHICMLACMHIYIEKHNNGYILDIVTELHVITILPVTAQLHTM